MGIREINKVEILNKHIVHEYIHITVMICYKWNQRRIIRMCLTGLSFSGCIFLSGHTKEALMSGLSDMEYLRSKVAQTDDTMEESEEKNDAEEDDDDEEEDGGPAQPTDSAYESGENTSRTKTSVSSEDKRQSKAKKNAKHEVTVQMDLHVNRCYTAQYCFQSEVVYTHLFVPDGAGNTVHRQAERSPVQRERGERARA